MLNSEMMWHLFPFRWMNKRSLHDSDKTIKTLGGQTYNIKTIGSKWGDLQASRFNINSQLYYVMMDANKNTLAVSNVDSSNVDSYNKFLEEGIINS